MNDADLLHRNLARWRRRLATARALGTGLRGLAWAALPAGAYAAGARAFGWPSPESAAAVLGLAGFAAGLARALRTPPSPRDTALVLDRVLRAEDLIATAGENPGSSLFADEVRRQAVILLRGTRFADLCPLVPGRRLRSAGLAAAAVALLLAAPPITGAFSASSAPRASSATLRAASLREAARSVRETAPAEDLDAQAFAAAVEDLLDRIDRGEAEAAETLRNLIALKDRADALRARPELGRRARPAPGTGPDDPRLRAALDRLSAALGAAAAGAGAELDPREAWEAVRPAVRDLPPALAARLRERSRPPGDVSASPAPYRDPQVTGTGSAPLAGSAEPGSVGAVRTRTLTEMENDLLRRYFGPE